MRAEALGGPPCLHLIPSPRPSNRTSKPSWDSGWARLGSDRLAVLARNLAPRVRFQAGPFVGLTLCSPISKEPTARRDAGSTWLDRTVTLGRDPCALADAADSRRRGVRPFRLALRV